MMTHPLLFRRSSLHHTFVMIEQCLGQHRGSGGFDGSDFRVVCELPDFEQLICVTPDDCENGPTAHCAAVSGSQFLVHPVCG